MLLVVCACAMFQYSHSQSFSASQVMNMVSSKDKESVIKLVTEKGFTYKSNKTDYNISLVSYTFKGTYGQEEIGIMKSDELFGIVYQPVKTFYSSLKEKLLTADFVYVYSGGGNKYYENHKMRIGVNDIAGIISLFVAK